MVRGRNSAGPGATGRRMPPENRGQIMWSLAEAEDFFYEHAGWAHPMDADAAAQEAARRENARRLARAEGELWRGPFVRTVEPDPEPWDGDVPWDGPVFVVGIDQIGAGFESRRVASLCGVAVASESDPYVRVVAAEIMAGYLDSGEHENGY